ncbi:GDP dissociation inhibitor-domain-containing protein [Schizophyllum commune]
MDSHFDVAIVGTDLAHAVAAAALAKAGLRVVHVDKNAYYGAHDASLAADELGADIPHPRRYNIGLAPGLVPAHGPLIDALVASGVARYLDFRLIDRIALADQDAIHPVPTDKAAIFAADIPLLHKRRLMSFLRQQAEASDVPSGTLHTALNAAKLPPDLVNAVAYALAFATRADDPAASSLARLRTHLRSAGRYGPSPFLLPHYGGPGELAQAFCRAAAVGGAVYILGRDYQIESTADKHTLTIDEVPDVLTADLLIHHVEDPSLIPIARAIAIIARPISFVNDPEEATVVVFPPSDGGFAVTGLITGSSSMSCPDGSYIVYLSTPLPNVDSTSSPAERAESVLRPYLDRLLAAAGPDPPAEIHTETVAMSADADKLADAAAVAGASAQSPNTSPSEEHRRIAPDIPTPPATDTRPRPPIRPLFTHFYVQHTPASEILCSGTSTIIPAPGAYDVPEDLTSESSALSGTAANLDTPSSRMPPPLPSGPDAAATTGARIFWAAIRALRQKDGAATSADEAPMYTSPELEQAAAPDASTTTSPSPSAATMPESSSTDRVTKRRAALATTTLWPPLVVRDADDEGGW